MLPCPGRFAVLSILLVSLAGCSEDTAPGTNGMGSDPEARTITWGELVPADASPVVYPFTGLDESYDLVAAQPIGEDVDDSLSGQRLRIPGFVVPLEFDAEQRLVEFLLVPYYGACLHTPPPPANQTVHARLASGIALDNFYEPVWATGQMETRAFTSMYGKAGYSLSVSLIEPYLE